MADHKGTITRRMDTVLDGLNQEFRSLCDREDFENKLEALKQSGEKSDRSSKLRVLFDMFDACGIEYEKGRSNDYYESLINYTLLPESTEIEDRMLAALYNRYVSYPSPEDYMQRMVDRLCSTEDGWQNDSLRIRILKQFIKYGNYLSDAGYGGKKAICDYVKEKTKKKNLSDEDVLNDLDDQIFSCLDTATKAQKKPKEKYGLLKTADDLAAGKFRAEGATRKSLYLFAIVFGMTYYSGGMGNSGIFDPKTDIETNLFRDYYTNNLMRFLTEAYKGKLCEYELDPSGQGINYKNFAEMIYLYYISGDYTPQEKIRLSSAMIQRVQEKQFHKGRVNTKEKQNTAFYKGLFRNDRFNDFFVEDKLSLGEAEFETFICETYYCDTYAGSYSTKNGTVDLKTGEIQLETEQNSAFHVYQSVLEELTEKVGSLENCNYGLWFTDVAAFRKKEMKNICDRNTDIDRKKFEEFMDLLAGVNSFIGGKTKALYVKSKSAVTRTTIIVAFYYLYNALHEDDRNEHRKNFEEVFNSFKREIDPKLQEAYYQPLSGRNIFDVLVVFSSYAYINI